MHAFDLIMFDLDGTLVDTAPEIFDAVNDTLRYFALPEVTLQQVNDWIGHGPPLTRFFRSLPSTYSMLMYLRPISSPMSWMRTM